VESLTASRKNALNGTGNKYFYLIEPSDSIRVVNAVLTQIDMLKKYKNVLIMTTSNITGAIDLAFVGKLY
jgi:SpoVK/Ycf46/Vps4 family AAA+-type ATPase